MAASNNFRKNLRFVMKTRNISQRALADMADVNFVSVNRVLVGKSEPTMHLAEKISEAIGFQLKDLLVSPLEFQKKSAATY